MKHRLLLLGISLLSTAILIAVGIGWLRGNVPVVNTVDPAVAELPVPLNRIPSARAAYQALEGWASGWAADYTLVSANLEMKIPTEEVGGWSFMLYSAKKGKLISVLVSSDEIFVLREQSALYPPREVETATWTYDAPSVLAGWWKARGQAHWREMEVDRVILTLRQDRAGYGLWKLICLNAGGKVLDAWYVRADTGEVIDSPSAP